MLTKIRLYAIPIVALVALYAGIDAWLHYTYHMEYGSLWLPMIAIGLTCGIVNGVVMYMISLATGRVVTYAFAIWWSVLTVTVFFGMLVMSHVFDSLS